MKNTASMKVIIGTVLFLSLSANMALAGMVAGSQQANTVFAKVATALSAFADLSDPSRDKAVDIVKKEWPDIQKDIKGIRAKREQIKQLLGSPDYKRAEAEKLMAEIRRDVTHLQETGQTLALDIADAITPEERMALIKKVDLKP
ncbi:MAG: periplasmic heavy metal sensor [Alphaproteobacteria bacterium]